MSRWQAIMLKPDYAEAHWNQGIVYLSKGSFQEGWREYDWRRKTDWHVSAYPHSHRKPRWNGESFVGRRLLVHCEQGMGDCIQFVRYLPQVKALGGTVIFEAWKSLHGLLRDFDGIDELEELSFDTQTQAQFDAHVSIMDLPGLFGTSEYTIPASVPYIHSDPVKVAHWRQKLAGPDLKVGIVWAGSARHSNDHNRSCRSEHLGRLAQTDGVRLYSLQKGVPARQANEMSFVSRASRPRTAGCKPAAASTSQPEPSVPNLGEQFQDFTDTAAAIEGLDLVISVDTAIVHLAGAMGKPVWVLLAYAPDWRWMLDRTDSPWYPTMRLFRQKQWGHWDSVFRVVGQELRVLAEKQTEVIDG
ncbi:MAG: glycosyltransferase family 9 protein [Planctomycetota bacterium]